VTELSDRIRASVGALFSSEERDVAERALVGLRQLTPHADLLERIRLAAVRLSGGRMAELEQAIELAQLDWRDLLVASGFADDAREHTRWTPRVLDAETMTRWLAGETLADVTWAPGQLACVRFAAGPKQRASAIRLTSLEPEPRYAVRLHSGEEVEVFQRQLAPVE
jgi:hypothetical protein